MLVANARDELKARFIAKRLSARKGGSLLFIARDQPRLAQIAGLVRFFAPTTDILTFPAWDCLPDHCVSPNGQLMAERLQTLARLAEGRGNRPRLVLTTANAVLQRVPTAATVRGGHFRSRAGERLDRDALVDYLGRTGYARTGTVVEPGEYAVRGGLLDVFPTADKQPLRLDFFGSTVETIRTFDPLTQCLARARRAPRDRARQRGGVRSGGDRSLQGRLPPAVRRRHRRPAVRCGQGGPELSRHGALAPALPRAAGDALRLSGRRRRDRLRPSGAGRNCRQGRPDR